MFTSKGYYSKMVTVIFEKYPTVLWGLFLLLLSTECDDSANPESTTKVMPAAVRAGHLNSPTHDYESTSKSVSKFHSEDRVPVTPTPSQELQGAIVPTTKRAPEQITSFTAGSGKGISSAQRQKLEPHTSISSEINVSSRATKITDPGSARHPDPVSTVAARVKMVSDVSSSSHSLTSKAEKPAEEPSSSGESATRSPTLPPTRSNVGLVHTQQHSSTLNPSVKTSSVTPNVTTRPPSIQGVNHSTVSPKPPGLSTNITTTPASRESSAFEPITISVPVNTTKTNSQSPSRTSASLSMASSSVGSKSTTELPPTTQTFSLSTITTTAPSTNSTGGVLIPKKLPSPTTRPTRASLTTPFKDDPPDRGIQPCLRQRHGLIDRCLIAIASLAGLATLFMVSTIILCIRLSSRRHSHKAKKNQQGTEMVCISALLPESSFSYERQRNPKNRGAHLHGMKWDPDDEENDNLTLNSFLPDNDSFV